MSYRTGSSCKRNPLILLLWVIGLPLILSPLLRVGLAAAQDSPPSLDDAIRGYEASTHSLLRGIPEDWTSRHLVYSNPNSSKAERDPRYWIQQIRRQMTQRATSDAIVQLSARKRRSHRDWSQDLGSGGSVGAGQFPAKYSFTTSGTPHCNSDFAVFNTGLAGSASQASIIAYNQLYKTTCGSNVPATLWAYNTGGTVKLSPVLSLDGTQIAFVQTVGSVASLVVLKPATGGTQTVPVTLISTSNYAGCTAPCMISLTFNGSPNDTLSAPFYDYSGSDTLYVGDAVGKLHAFHPVFGGGTPVEVTSGLPITVSQSTTKEPLTSPVFDAGLGLVFVGDGHGASATNDGEVHAVNISTRAVTNSMATICHGIGYADPPLLDPSAGQVYFGCANDQGGGNCTSGDACIRQFPESFTSGALGSAETIGTGADAHIYPGGFDNIYFNSSSSNPTGNLYVCGDPGGKPTLYRVPITNDVLGPPITVATMSSSTTATCTPVTEFYNTTTSTDWLFVGVSAMGSESTCTANGGCVYSFDATSALAAGTAASAGITSTGGSSGIIVDNIGAATATTANVYYSTLGNQSCTGGTGGCAVQVSQSQLQ